MIAQTGALASVLPYGPALAEHCVLLAGLAPGRKPKQEPLSGAEGDAVFGGAQAWEAWLEACETAAPEGFITLKGSGACSAVPLSQQRDSLAHGSASACMAVILSCALPIEPCVLAD